MTQLQNKNFESRSNDKDPLKSWTTFTSCTIETNWKLSESCVQLRVLMQPSVEIYLMWLSRHNNGTLFAPVKMGERTIIAVGSCGNISANVNHFWYLEYPPVKIYLCNYLLQRVSSTFLHQVKKKRCHVWPVESSNIIFPIICFVVGYKFEYFWVLVVRVYGFLGNRKKFVLFSLYWGYVTCSWSNQELSINLDNQKSMYSVGSSLFQDFKMSNPQKPT